MQPTIVDLTATIAEAAGVPLNDVQHRVRYLTTASVLPKGKQGRHSPRVTGTPKDAANLLLAVMAGGAQTEAPEAVALYGSLLGVAREDWMPDDHDIGGLPSGTFADAVATIIRRADELVDFENNGRRPIIAIGISSVGSVVQGFIAYHASIPGIPMKYHFGDVGHFHAAKGQFRETRIGASIIRPIAKLYNSVA